MDKINDLDMSMLVMNGIDDMQVIHGSKTVVGDVYVTNTAQLLHANDIDLKELQLNTLKVHGDQDLPGNFFIESIKTQRYLLFQIIPTLYLRM